MPRKERDNAENERIRVASELENAAASAPPHLAKRMGRASPLITALQAPAGYNWRGIKFGLDGQPAKHPNHDTGWQGANAARQGQALEWAKQVIDRYGPLLWRRDGPAQIARAEGVDTRTVRRARERLKANGQA
jgi:hypothetical protein